MSTTTSTTSVAPMAIVDGKTIVYDPGIDMLGATYDVQRQPYSDVRYRGPAVVSGITGYAVGDPGRRLLEVDPVQGIFYSLPGTVTAAARNELEVTSAHGSNLTKYSNSLAARAKVEANYGAFSGEVKSSLSIDASGSQSYTYLTLFDSRITADASIDIRAIDSGGPMTLDPALRAALDDPSYPPSTLFERWGTHLITAIRIGGQIRYTCYTAETTSSSESELDVSGKVRYKDLSGSSSVKASTAVSIAQSLEYITGESQLLIYGGSAAGQAQVGSGEGYEAWITSVAANPSFAEFLELTPLWALCADPSRASALETAYRYRQSLALAPASVLIATGGTEFKKSDYDSLDRKATGSAATKAIQSFAGTLSNEKHWLSENDEEVMVGFGGRIKGDHKLTRILVAVLNVRTGAIRRIAVGDGTTDPSEYEGWCQVPDGCVMTGLRLRSDGDDLKNVRVFYQALRSDDPANGYLDPDRSEAVVGNAKGSYEIEYVPDASRNRKVLTGIVLRARKNHSQVNLLALQAAELTAAG